MGGVDLSDANAHDKKWYWANCTNTLDVLESAASKSFLHDILPDGQILVFTRRIVTLNI